MFESCDFLMGQGQSIVIVIPAELPDSETYTVSISQNDIKFRAGYSEIAHIKYENSEVYNRLAYTPQVGLVEYPKEGEFPDCITAVAYIEVRKTVQ